MKNTCKKCNETKDVSFFSKHSSYKSGYSNTCKKCKYKRFVEMHSVEKKEKRKKYVFSEKVIKYNKEYIRKDKDKVRYRNKENIKNLNYSYLVDKLKRKGFTKENITPELIEVQRIIIKTKRLCKTSQI